MQFDWDKKHILKVNNEVVTIERDLNSGEDWKVYRKKIEPWLSAIFQSEYLSLLLGSGIIPWELYHMF